MAPQDKTQTEGKKRLIEKIIPTGTVYDSISNWISDRTRKIGIILPYRTIPEQEQTTRKRLKPYFTDNDQLVIRLQQLEAEWLLLKKEIGDFDGNPDKGQDISIANESVTMMYKNLGPYTDVFHAAYEISLFMDGVGAKWSDKKGVKVELKDKEGNILSETKIDYKHLNIKGKTIIDAEGERETLMPFGYLTIEGMRTTLMQHYDELKKVEGDDSLGSSTVTKLQRMVEQRDKLLEFISEQETAQKEYIETNAIPSLAKMIAKRKKLFAERPKDVRFKHTYKIIRPYILVNVEKGKKIPLKKVLNMEGEINEAKLVEELTNLKDIDIVKFEDSFKDFKHVNKYGVEFEKLPWEVALGRDARGKILEVDEDGTVLLDKWWHETYINEWQRDIVEIKCGKKPHTASKFPSIKRTIRLKQTIPGKWDDPKTNAGEVYQMLNYFKTEDKIRKIDPAFIDHMDVLEAGSHIDNEYDAYRDDIRDARTHGWTKTVYDYTLAMFKWDRHKLLHNPIYRGIYPTKDCHIKFDCHKPHDKRGGEDYGYVGAYADMFEKNIPDDEKAITSTYDYFNSYETKTGKFKPDPDPSSPIKPYRIPTHLSPAFDRRALGQPWIHWGRMYYYDPVDHICRYSENPYPTITSRGIGKWIIYSVLKLEKKFRDQQEAVSLSEKGYDYGIRAYGLQQFPKDVLSPGVILQYVKK